MRLKTFVSFFGATFIFQGANRICWLIAYKVAVVFGVCGFLCNTYIGHGLLWGFLNVPHVQWTPKSTLEKISTFIKVSRDWITTVATECIPNRNQVNEVNKTVSFIWLRTAAGYNLSKCSRFPIKFHEIKVYNPSRYTNCRCFIRSCILKPTGTTAFYLLDVRSQESEVERERDRTQTQSMWKKWKGTRKYGAREKLEHNHEESWAFKKFTNSKWS